MAAAAWRWGVDGRLNDSTTVGVAYSYLNSNIHSDLGNKTSSVTEKDSSAALSTGSQRYEVGELGAGVRLAGRRRAPAIPGRRVVGLMLMG